MVAIPSFLFFVKAEPPEPVQHLPQPVNAKFFIGNKTRFLGL